MDLIIEGPRGTFASKAITTPYDLDLCINGTNDFQLSLDYQMYDARVMGNGARVHVPGEEYGGIVQDIYGATNTNKICLHGYTWRGILSRHIIEPPEGSDYYTASGELGGIIWELIDAFGLQDLFLVNMDEYTIAIYDYAFDRYTNLADGIEKMLEKYGYRMNMTYIPYSQEIEMDDDPNSQPSVYVNDGYVEVRAVPVKNYGSEIEVSQDSKIDFYSQDYRMGVNHLICLGTGQLAQRTVVHLYADADGNISKTQTFFGTDEIAEVFENPSADAETLEETGINRFQQLLNFKKFTADAKYIDDINLSIGDTITGKDLITGTVVTKPIRQKIVKITNGVPSVEYTI